MEKFYIPIHSFIDVITNSSTEIFMFDTDKAVKVVEDIIKEKEKEFPPDYYPGYNGFVHIEEAEDWQVSEAFGYYNDDEDIINYLKAKGYKVEKVEDAKKFIRVSCERGFMNDNLRDFINNTFNVVYHTTEG